MTLHQSPRVATALAALLVLAFTACKTPQATQPKDTLAKLPPTATDTLTPLPAWRDFFQDTTLRNLIDTALHNNRDLKIMLQELVIAKSAIAAKRGTLLPTVTANIGAGVSKVGRYTAEGAGNVGTELTPGHNIPTVIPDLAPSLQVDWTIDLWQKLNSGKRASVERFLASQAGQRVLRGQLVADVAENYYTLLALDSKLAVVTQYITLQQKAVKLARIQKEADAETQLGVEKFEAELAKAQADEWQLRQAVVETETHLNLLLGRFPAPIVRHAGDFLQLALPTTVRIMPTQLLLQRADVQQAEHQLRAAKWDVEAARKAFLPSLNLSAALGLDAFNPKYLVRTPESVAFSVLGSFTAPLINRRAIQADFEQANALQIEALYNYDKALLTTCGETHTLQAKLQNLAHYAQLKQQQDSALQRAVSAAQQLYFNNRASYLDVLDSERDQLDCQMERIDTQLQQLSAAVEVYRGFF
ncbi:TolC family protein [Segatella oulorum]|uniref:TolC family protein n=1 Tax=Segatella oulorum TaxID=28136 RepID=UPI0028E1C0F7|nr:TolC family protein [Segatella oulorum]